MASQIEICNQALVLIGQEPVTALDNTTKQSRLCAQLYNPTLEALLREYPWTFAIERVVLSPEMTPPAFGYSHSFVLPVDCMRLVSMDIPDGEYQLEKNRILTDYESIQLRYVSKTNSAKEYDGQFVYVLALRLAIAMCQSLTADQDLLKILTQLENKALLRAMNSSAIEDSPQQIVSAAWLESRYA